MPKTLWWFLILGAVAVFLHVPADAKDQKRNFNLNCGLIGSFAQYPQHNNLCKWQVFCTDPKTCIRKLAVPTMDVEAVLSEELETAVPGETPAQENSSNGVNLAVGVQGSISTGGLSASGSANAGAGTDSGGGAGGSAGASAGGDAGGGSAGAGGGLGVGGL